jgi:hypothetical protein
MDGSSAFSSKVQNRSELRMFTRGSFEPLKATPAEFQRQRKAALAHKIEVFGVGKDGRDRIYRIGPHQELLGKTVSSLSPQAKGDVSASLQDAGDYDDVQPKTGFIPTHPVAKVSGGASGETRDVAIAVDGRIEAVSKTFYLATDKNQELISAMIPPWTLKPGRNTIDFFQVLPSGRLQALQ